MSSVSCRAAILSAAFALSTAAPALAQYCGASVTYPCSGNEYISNVTIGTINNSTACGLDYEDFSGTVSTAVTPGANEAIAVTVSTWWSSDQVYVFCDWNQNFVFDAGEETILVDPGSHIYAGTIAVPPGAPTGMYRMRVRLNYGGIPPACGLTSYGNIEDYTLIVGTPTTNPSVSGTATPNPCMQGANVVLAATAVAGANPTSTGMAVSGDLTAIGGAAAVAFLDDGIAPDVTAGDDIFTTQATVGAVPGGAVSIPLTVSDAQARVGTGSIGLQVGYCAADVTTPCLGNEYISDVTVGAMNNVSACGLGYEDFTYLTIGVGQGGTAPVSVVVSTWYSSDSVTVFCDWNMNGVLDDAGEVTDLVDPGSHTYSGMISVPVGAIMGTTRMRVRLNYGVNPGPCGTTYYGNVEDYSVIVGPPGPPANDACANAFVLLSGNSGITTLATNDDSSSCDATGNDVWYTFTAGVTGASGGSLNLDTCGSAVDTVISVYGACAGAELACDDNSAGCGAGAASLSVNVAAYQTVLIRVSDKGTGGAYALNSSWDPIPPCSGPTLTTLYAFNNYGDPGNQMFFDLNVTKPGGITISQIDVNSQDMVGSAFVMSVYTTPGTYLGSEANMGVWTFASNANGILMGADNPSPTELVTPLFLAPGTYGVALVMDPIAAFSYTNGTGANQVYSNADLTLTAGAAQNVAFTAPTFTPRVFNGSIRYDCSSGPTSYCTPTSPGTTNSCVPTIAGTNNPNLAHSNSCIVTVSNVEGAQNGLIFYGVSGTMASPWCAVGGNSFLCVKAPLERGPVQPTGGAFGTCLGSLVMDWNAFQLANPTSMGNPWTLGDNAWLQGWFRDPPSCKTSFLSEALVLTYQ